MLIYTKKWTVSGTRVCIYCDVTTRYKSKSGATYGSPWERMYLILIRFCPWSVNHIFVVVGVPYLQLTAYLFRYDTSQN